MLELFLAELRRSWIVFHRYPFEAIVGIFIFTTFFYGLFLSARYIAGSSFQFGERLDSIVIGYVLWTLVSFIQINIAGELQYEAQTGTLEQIFLSRYSAIKVFLMRTFANLIIQIFIMISILIIIIILTGIRLSFPLSLLLPLATVLMGAYGIAFTIGSIALLFKRVQQMLTIFQFALLFLIATPIENWRSPLYILGQLLPMTPGAELLRDLMARGESLNFSKLIIAFINGGIYFAVGLLIFRFAEHTAKKRGMLSGY
ncbi:putative ABC-2 type transporter, permease protein (plasmid) [Tolypothrix tenuis PCC 7101]|uniref:Putative ABC-2 type transporter, permease protein n=1 Tax=Tolypothrix tenuis PCC 7101 TaxID=231146 RepID=A0A1Z4NBF1_9CYAN|nr:ABC transporter permease [Aulosira sp. FACHB-113]BAZ03054.1 putative ABC-2 type transporter, permease protein [Tolypothrix tenuis PCC 7101]BAZ78208.1 putative ABC-2 type transporter, permease protein [Aulosira laxa NIES-50]